MEGERNQPKYPTMLSFSSPNYERRSAFAIRTFPTGCGPRIQEHPIRIIPSRFEQAVRTFPKGCGRRFQELLNPIDTSPSEEEPSPAVSAEPSPTTEALPLVPTELVEEEPGVAAPLKGFEADAGFLDAGTPLVPEISDLVKKDSVGVIQRTGNGYRDAINERKVKGSQSGYELVENGVRNLVAKAVVGGPVKYHKNSFDIKRELSRDTHHEVFTPKRQTGGNNSHEIRGDKLIQQAQTASQRRTGSKDANIDRNSQGSKSGNALIYKGARKDLAAKTVVEKSVKYHESSIDLKRELSRGTQPEVFTMRTEGNHSWEAQCDKLIQQGQTASQRRGTESRDPHIECKIKGSQSGNELVENRLRNLAAKTVTEKSVKYHMSSVDLKRELFRDTHQMFTTKSNLKGIILGKD